MSESDTPNTTDSSKGEESQSPESPPKLRLSLRKTSSPDPGQSAEEKPPAAPPPQEEAAKPEETKAEAELPGGGDSAGGKLKLSLGPIKDVTPQPEAEKTDLDSDADPFDIKPNPVEGGTALKLGIKPKAPEPEAKPATPPPVKKKKSGITIRGLTGKPFGPQETKEEEKPAPEATISEEPGVESDAAPPIEAGETLAPSETQGLPEETKTAPPPAAKKAPPPPTKKKPVPAPPPPKSKVKLAKPAPAPSKEKKDKVSAPPPGKKKPADLKKPEKKPKPESAKASPKKIALVLLLVMGIFVAAGYFAISAFFGSSAEESSEPIASTPSASSQSPSAKPETPAPAPAIVKDSAPTPQPTVTPTPAPAVPIPTPSVPQLKIERVVVTSAEPESEPESEEVFQAAEPEQDENIIAFVDSLVIKGSIGDGVSARILVGNYKYSVNDVVDESLGVVFSGINKSTRVIIFTDAEGARYYKPF